ncbi:amino acid/polyamine transporter I [Elsinoe ampelina]|uniref:Amino acid/polyamine transporter I n=1 Tax=Elsinoe ampelina TaxID=302913 RepID=A0A6A6G601_9PEZI|nr:amino acid/polyamine transporter I [Elsinoe ampelina]
MVYTLVLSVAEITSAYTTSGGIYHAASQLAPPKRAALAAWVVGWLNLFGQICGVASVEYGAAEILLATCSIITDGTYKPNNRHTVGVMVLGTFLTGFVNSMSTKWLSKTTVAYIIFHGLVIVTCCATLLSISDDKHTSAYVMSHFESSSGWHPSTYSALFGLLSVSWTITDFDASSHIAEEVRHPEIVVPRAIALGMLLAYIFGGIFTTTLAIVMGDPASILSTPLGQPVIQIFLNVLGKHYGALFAFTAYLILKISGITAMQALARTEFAFSRDKLIPGHRIWVRTCARTKTPVYAVWLCVVVCAAVNLIALASTVAILAVFNVFVIALDLSYVVVILLKVLGGRWAPGPLHLGRASRWCNLVGVVWTVFIAVMFVQPVVRPVEGQTMNYASVFFVVLLVWIFASWWFVGRKHFRGPAAQVEMVEETGMAASMRTMPCARVESPRPKHVDVVEVDPVASGSSSAQESLEMKEVGMRKHSGPP